MKNPKELHLEFVRLGRERYRLMNKMLLILPEIYESGIWKKYAKDIEEYAGRFGGIGSSSVEKRLRLEKHLVDKPCLKAAIEKVGVGKVALMATLATPQNEEVLADKTLNMSKSALETLSKELRSKTSITEISPCQAKAVKITLELDEEMTFLFLKFKQKTEKKLKSQISNKEAMRTMLEQADERHPSPPLSDQELGASKKIHNGERNPAQTCEGESQKNHHSKPANLITGDGITHATDTANSQPVKTVPGGDGIATTEPRPIRAARKRQVLGNGRCQYNNCNKPAEHIHHPDRYAKTKNHNKLIALCKDHHEFMHNGLIENETSHQENWAINIRKAPDQTDLLYRKYRRAAM